MKRLPLFALTSFLLSLSLVSLAQAPVMTSWATSPIVSETRLRFRMHDRSINNGFALCEANLSMTAATCALIDEATIYVYQDDGVGTYGTQLYSVTFSPGIGAVPIDINDRTRIQIISAGSTQNVYARLVAKGVSTTDGFTLTTPNRTTTIVESDSYDPNESAGTASTITSGTTHTGLLVNNDTDYYPVTITSGNRNLVVSMRYMDDYRSPESRLDLDLYLSNGTSTLASSTSSAVSIGSPITETIDEILDPGTYYIVVRPKSTDPNRNFYELNWTTYASPTYQISGIIRDEGAYDISGVTMNGLPGSPVTNEDGYYGLVVEHGWSGTVTPTLAGYTFSPESRTYTDVEEAHNSDSYIAMLNNPVISGRVTNGEGAGEAGVIMSGFPEAVMTDADGYYSGTVWYNWTGTITPTAAGLEFTPTITVYPPVKLNLSGRNYTSSVGSVNVSGKVTRLEGIYPLVGVPITGSPGPAVTNSSGDYTFDVLYGSSFTITPVLEGYTFDPADYTFTNITSSSVVDFDGTLNTYQISGTIRDGSNNNVAPVTLMGLPGDPLTDGNGDYSAEVEHGWSGTVTPTLTGYTFDPVSVDYSNVTAVQSQNYTATPNTYQIDGYVRTAGGTGIAGVMMLGLSVNPTTDSEGYYSGDVIYGHNITVIPTLDGYSFSPTSTNYSPVTGDASTDYTGTPGPYLNTSQHIILLTEESGANDLVSITSNVDWTVTCPESWITLSPLSGSDNGSFTITANTANTGTAQRDATVTVAGGGLTRILDVSQAGSDALLEVSSSTATLGSAAASNQAVTITSNIAWSVSETADWLSVAPVSGTGNGSLTITADLANTSVDDRSATVTLTGGGITRNIEVTQSGTGLYLEVSVASITLLPDNGAGQVIGITSNLNWTATEPANWLSVTPETGSNDAVITIAAISENESVEDRSAVVTVTGGSITRTIAVTQSGGAASLGITAASALLEAAEGSTLTLNIISNIAWTLSDTAAWLSVTPVSGTGDMTITVWAETANTGSSERICDLVAEGGGLVRNITITQAAGSSNGTELLSELSRLTVYPNPASKSLFLESTRGLNFEVLVQLLDISGKVLLRQQLNDLMPGVPVEIDVSEYPEGQYLLHISHQSDQRVVKFIKNR